MTGMATEEFKMTELGPIPCDWEIGMLGSGRYFQILPSGIDNFTGQKKYLSTSSIQGWKIESLECLIYYGNRPSRANMQPRLNTVWFAKMIGSVKVYCFTESNREEVTEYILSTGFCGIRCKEDVDTEYLKFIFLSDYFNTLKDSLCSGATQRAINNDSISSITIAFPPLPEQKKIVYFLSTVQTAIEKTEAVIKATRALKKSLMKHLFAYGPVSIDEAKNVLLKETEIAVVPEAWSVKTLAESVESIEYGYSISIPSEENMYGVPIISTADITKDGSILYNQVRRINPPKRLTERLLLRDGDLLFNWRNAPELVGKTAIYEEQPQRHIYASFIMRIRTDGSLSNSFLCYLLNYYRQIGVFLKLARRAVNQANYNRNEISVLRVPLPPLAVQQKTADILSGVDRRIEVEENKKKALEALFKTLVSNFMTGKIKVNNLEVPV